MTFLFTDLEGSTRLWQDHPNEMQPALARHDALVREAIESHDGYLVKTTGDGFHAAFATAHHAVDAAVAAQLTLGAEPWDGTGALHVRMGLHTCEAEVRDGDYYGSGVNRAARLMSVAHGGQIVVSAVTSELVRESPVELVDLGEHRLRDLTNTEHIFEVRAPGLAAGFPPLLSLDAFPGNLPLRPTSFVGRGTEIDKIGDALRRSPLVTLTGVGGVGKTRLAVQIAAQVLPHYPDGAWFCELAAATDPESLEQIVAACFGVSMRTGMDLAQSIVEYLRSKHLLLVLDNCEHLLDAAGDLAQAIVMSCPNVRLLATSREGLAVDGEQVVPLRSLALPAAADGDDPIQASDAVQLFLDRARSTQDDFSLTPADVVAVAEICRRLDGIPLAIELAAARAVAMSPSEIAELLDERFRLLAGGRRSAVERHQTLRATVDWSYALLRDHERLVFERLGVFTGSFDGADAAAIVSGDGIERFDVIDALTALVSKSMLTAQRTPSGTTRYQFLETLRHYARERLDDAGTIDAWRRRHAEHFAEFAERVGPLLLGPDEIQARSQIIAVIDNLRAAFTWAIDRDERTDAELAFRIVNALAMEAAMCRSTGVGAWGARALERSDVITEAQRLGARSALCWDLFQRGDVVSARAVALEAAEAAPSDADAVHLLQAYQCALTTAGFLGDLDGALAMSARALDLAAETGSAEWSRSAVLSTRAMAFAGNGRTDDACNDAEQALAIALQIRNPTVHCLALQALGWATWMTDPESALGALEESVLLMRSGAIEGGLDAALSRLATARLAVGDPLGALDALHETFWHMREIGERVSVVAALDSSLVVFGGLGESEPAAVLAGVMHADLFGPSNLLTGPEADRHRAALDHVRDQLGDVAFEGALAHGAAMTDDEAMSYALGELTRVRGELEESARHARGLGHA